MQVAQDHPMATLIAVASFLLIATLWWMTAGRKWYRKVRRRKGGVYLWRTDRHHLRPRWLAWLGTRETAYVGESVNFHLRAKQHLGQSRFDPATGKAVKRGTVKVPAQPWSDLRPRMHRVIRLPWWLCWKWVLRPLETIVILLTWPRYNDAKNHWNPRRITKGRAVQERAARDRVRAVWGTTKSVNYLGRTAGS